MNNYLTHLERISAGDTYANIVTFFQNFKNVSNKFYVKQLFTTFFIQYFLMFFKMFKKPRCKSFSCKIIYTKY